MSKDIELKTDARQALTIAAVTIASVVLVKTVQFVLIRSLYKARLRKSK